MIGIDIGLAFLGDIIARAAVCGTLTLLGSASAGVNCGMRSSSRRSSYALSRAGTSSPPDGAT